MPTPIERVKGKADYGTTNVRHTHYSHWQQYVDLGNRCVVPVTSFAEPSATPNNKDPETGIQRNYWFARDEILVLKVARGRVPATVLRYPHRATGLSFNPSHLIETPDR
jgi:putative SOS response-associated peptidase YedK